MLLGVVRLIVKQHMAGDKGAPLPEGLGLVVPVDTVRGDLVYGERHPAQVPQRDAAVILRCDALIAVILQQGAGHGGIDVQRLVIRPHRLRLRHR